MPKLPSTRPPAKIFRRQPSHKLSYRFRWLRLTSHDQVHLRFLRKAFLSCLVLHRGGCDDPRLEKVLILLSIKYFSTSFCFDPPIQLDSKPLKTCIDDFHESDCYIFFRFQKPDLRLLSKLLKFPDVIIFDNKSKMSGEEVFLRGLYELSSGETKHKISANVFGWEWSIQSRAFSWFILHMFDSFEHLVTDNLSWRYRNGFFESSRTAIFQKMSAALRSAGKLDLLEEDVLGVSHFIDCNCLPCSVVGGGPAEDGANAMRWSDEIQQAFYNGWKSIHGLKHQTVDNAFGFPIHIKGPTSVRRNDLTLLRESDINNTFANLQLEVSPWKQCRIFGDSAYKP